MRAPGRQALSRSGDLFDTEDFSMSKPDKAPPAPPLTLNQQKADFTAEGSPPPGKVSTSTPTTTLGAHAALPAGKPRLRAAATKSKRNSPARYP